MTERRVDVVIKGKNEVGPAVDGLKQLGAQLGSLKSLAAGALGGIGVVGVLKESFKAYSDQIQAETKLAATLAATGNAAKLSAKDLVEFASKRQELTTFADEVTIAAEAMLASFKNISGDTFKRVIVDAQDLSTALGMDLNSAVMKLGKALNNPEEGMKSLSKAGVILTDQQKEQIKAFMGMNEVAKAQAVILKEIESRFGGISEQMANTPQGQIEQLKNSIGEIAESIGMIIAPSVERMAKDMKKFADDAQRANIGLGVKASPQDKAAMALAFTSDPMGSSQLAGLTVRQWIQKSIFGSSDKGLDATIAQMSGELFPTSDIEKEMARRAGPTRQQRNAASARGFGSDFFENEFISPLAKEKAGGFNIWGGINSLLGGFRDMALNQRLGAIGTELANPFALIGRGLAGAFSGVGRVGGGSGSDVVGAELSPFVKTGFASQQGSGGNPVAEKLDQTKEAIKALAGEQKETGNDLLDILQRILDKLDPPQEATI